ncbi:peptidase S8/S53 domain-containing protein [Mycena vitilis]|nr:peptidase S8/S53 domain-containing protein [Mycena vitilis]
MSAIGFGFEAIRRKAFKHSLVDLYVLIGWTVPPLTSLLSEMRAAGCIAVIAFSLRVLSLPVINERSNATVSRSARATKRAVGKTWNLARLAQPDKLEPGKNGQGTYGSDDWSVGLKDGLGHNVYIYVVDTGVNDKHPLLSPRVERGMNVQDREPGAIEGDGHGTEVAGAAAATGLGVAPGAIIVPIKGQAPNQAMGIEEARLDFQKKKMLNPNLNAGAVINLSVAAASSVPDLKTEIAAALKANMHVVIAAGNQKQDRCNGDWVTSRTNPEVQDAINVGAIDIDDHIAVYPTQTDPGSNYGECVDIYAGGYNIVTAGKLDELHGLASGTSVAAPQVAGIIAGIISTTEDGFKITPAAMKSMILKGAVKGKIQGLSASSNNLLAQFPESFKQTISAGSDGETDDDDWGNFQGAPSS